MAKWNMKQRLLVMKEALKTRKVGMYTQRGADGCNYTYNDGSHCIVGVALTPAELKKVEDIGNNNAGVEQLVTDKIISCSKKDFGAPRITTRCPR